jgi:hypothetical protein
VVLAGGVEKGNQVLVDGETGESSKRSSSKDSLQLIDTLLIDDSNSKCQLLQHRSHGLHGSSQSQMLCIFG